LKTNPGKISPERVKVILEAIRIGVPLSKAAPLAGISYPTLNNWRVRGEKEKQGKYHDFFIALEKAKADFIGECLKRINEAAEGGQILTTTKKFFRQGDGLRCLIVIKRKTHPDWRAAAWLLERLYPDEYGVNQMKTSDTPDRLADRIEILIREKQVDSALESRKEKLPRLDRRPVLQNTKKPESEEALEEEDEPSKQTTNSDSNLLNRIDNFFNKKGKR